MTETIETKDYFEEQIDAVRLARKLSNIQAYVDAEPKVRGRALQFLSGFTFEGIKAKQ